MVDENKKQATGVSKKIKTNYTVETIKCEVCSDSLTMECDTKKDLNAFKHQFNSKHKKCKNKKSQKSQKSQGGRK